MERRVWILIFCGKCKRKRTSTSAIPAKASGRRAAGTMSMRTPLHAGAVPDASGRMSAAAIMCHEALLKPTSDVRAASATILRWCVSWRLNETRNKGGWKKKTHDHRTNARSNALPCGALLSVAGVSSVSVSVPWISRSAGGASSLTRAR